MATKKKKAKAKRSSGVRASWRGNLTFGLVSFPVQAVNALNRQQSDVHFHQLHAVCHRRIHYQKVCPVHGEVSNDEIVSGYEHPKGKYIEIEPEELDAIRTKEERALKIDAFVSPTTIDPIYFDGRMYYLVPDGKTAEEPYATIAAAMERAECWGVGQIVFSGKDQIVAVRPVEGRLHMAMLNYDEEIRTPQDIMSRPKSPPGGKTVRLAQTLIKAWYTDDFDFTAYDDKYRDRLERLIAAKKQGNEIVAPAEAEEEPAVVNLMDALKRSVAHATSGRGRKKLKRKRSA